VSKTDMSRLCPRVEPGSGFLNQVHVFRIADRDSKNGNLVPGSAGQPGWDGHAAAASGSGRTITVSATSMISLMGRSARSACSRIFCSLEAW
jgi:hypothetical protein